MQVLCPLAWASLESAAPDAATQQAALAGILSCMADLLKETASSTPEQQLLLPAATVAADGVAAAANGDADMLENQNVSEALVEALLCTSSAALPYKVQVRRQDTGTCIRHSDTAKAGGGQVAHSAR